MRNNRNNMMNRCRYAMSTVPGVDRDTLRAVSEMTIRSAGAAADAVITSTLLSEQAAVNAGRRGDRIVADAQSKAEGIIRQAQTEAEMEKKKAQATIRREITDVSAALTEKLLGREMKGDDHRAMINSFLDGIGDEQ